VEVIERESMLRIQRSASRGRTVFALSGRIEADDVAELQRLLESEAGDHNLILDLTDVRLVNRHAVRFLANCQTTGTKLRNCPAYIREWIAKERDGNNLRQP
jgi:anti-anti-sigma regulatory factor